MVCSARYLNGSVKYLVLTYLLMHAKTCPHQRFFREEWKFTKLWPNLRNKRRVCSTFSMNGWDSQFFSKINLVSLKMSIFAESSLTAHVFRWMCVCVCVLFHQPPRRHFQHCLKIRLFDTTANASHQWCGEAPFLDSIRRLNIYLYRRWILLRGWDRWAASCQLRLWPTFHVVLHSRVSGTDLLLKRYYTTISLGLSEVECCSLQQMYIYTSKKDAKPKVLRSQCPGRRSSGIIGQNPSVFGPKFNWLHVLVPVLFINLRVVP